MGFIELRLVKAVSPTDGFPSDSQTLDAGEHVQGSLLGRGVFGVSNKGFPRIV